MHGWPETQPTLLIRMASGQDQAWHQFSERYLPVVYNFARKRGLQHADAEELAQRVILRVFKASQRWGEETPPERFRNWLAAVASNALINLVVREAQQRSAGGSAHQLSLAGRVGPSTEDRDLWFQETCREQLRSLISRIRHEFSEESWQALEQTLGGGETVEAVARQQGKSIGAVYAARARILRRLQREVQA